jgi:hypothetical protein
MIESLTGIEDHRNGLTVFIDSVATVIAEKVRAEELSPETGERFLSGACNTLIGKCQDPLNSPQPGEVKGRVCRSLHACLFCENCWIFAEDLPATIQYRDRLLSEKKEMTDEAWEMLHGLAVRAIDQSILSAFPTEIVKQEAERLLLSIEAAEKICTEKVGGVGGRRWTQELDQRIREGRLPRDFRGKAGAEFRKKMIQGLHDSGMMVIPCGSFTYCVFEKERALCTKGERPSVNRCHPVECANSFILIEHVPVYQQKLASLEAMYVNLSEDAKHSPAGVLYAEEIRKIHQALQPFTNL